MTFVRTAVDERFWRLVDKDVDTPSCWLWTGKLDVNGYGVFHQNRQVRRAAHRMALLLLAHHRMAARTPAGQVIDTVRIP